MTTTVEDRAVQRFRKTLRGRLLEPDDPRYDEARTIWNGMINRNPAQIARCSGAADVMESVNFAREHNLLTAVKGGGHNVAGNAVCDDGLVIDLSPMDSIRVNPDDRIVRVEPGVVLNQLDHETQAFGLATPTGNVSTTGVAGLSLGGGWGWLSRTHGLTVDNLLSVDIVTADGKLRHASTEENEDLFWGVRGGGGNFGVVTSFEFQLHEVGPEVLAGPIFHRFEDASEMLRFHREFTSNAPDELCCYVAFLTAPAEPFLPESVHGSTILALALCYSGDVDEGQEVVRPLREAGDPLADLVEPMPFTTVQQLFDGDFEPGYRNYWKTQLVDPLPDEAIDIVVERANPLPTPHTQVLLEHLGGEISRVDPSATAYRNREAAFSFNVFPRWTDPAEDDEHIAWAQEFVDAIAPYATDGVGVNFLSQEGQDRVRASYGDNYNRLARLKDRYDPENLFRMNQNIEPRA
ncbi:MAG: FAD-binding oxidoreductase [Actinomycetota bacterium]